MTKHGVIHSYAKNKKSKKSKEYADAVLDSSYQDVEEEDDIVEPKLVEQDEVLSKDKALSLSYHYRALLDKSIYEEATSKLVPAEHVRQFLSLVGSKIRTLLIQMPDRLSSRIVHESNEETIHLLLFREVEQITNSIIEEMSEHKFLDILAKSAKDPVIRSRKIAQSHKGKEHVQDIEDKKET